MTATTLSMVIIDDNTSSLIEELSCEAISALAQIDRLSNLKAAKKKLRQNPADIILVSVSDSESEQVLGKICDYVRKGLADQQATIIALLENYADLDRHGYYEAGINELYDLHPDKKSFLSNKILRLLCTIGAFKERITQSHNQTKLLMSVNKFTHQRSSLTELVDQFAEALSNFCVSSLTLILRQNKQQEMESKVALSASDIDRNVLSELNNQTLLAMTEGAFSLRAPQVELSLSDNEIKLLNRITGEEIGSYLVFPLVVYNKVFCAVLCFISNENLDQVSVSNINIMKEAAEQLRVLLERRCAESQLRAQYQRLKATLSELQLTKDQLIHTEKMASVGNIAAGIAHEINNPLAYVLGNFSSMDEYVDTLLKMLDLHDRFMSSIDIESNTELSKIEKEIKQHRKDSDIEFVFDDIRAVVSESKGGLLRVRDIISDLSYFSRKQTLELAPFNLSELVGETLRLLKYEINDYIDIKVDIDVEGELLGHRGFFQQILTNLIKNASQALQENYSSGSECKIEVTASEEQEAVNIYVKDNGPGIAKENLNRVFEPFFTTKEIGKGTGLGLSVTYSLAQKMGGKLRVESEEGEFTAFIFSLPKKAEASTI